MSSILFLGIPAFFIFLLLLILPIIALVDVLKNEFTGNNKLAWIIVILILPLLGSILYFMMGERHKI